MSRKLFRMVSALTMLLLYVSVLAVNDLVALTCECRHHKADVHTAFDHVHVCDHQHHDHSCTSHDCDAEGVTIADKTCCNHNHSNTIALYTQPRMADDDQMERQAVLLAVVTDVLNFVEAEQTAVHGHEYSLYLLPPLSAGHAGGSALRAPPVLV